MGDGAIPDQEMCEHCSSWGPDSGYRCHKCEAVWPQGGHRCAGGRHIVAPMDSKPGMCVFCDRGDHAHG